MTRRPLILDLFCGAGGSAVGYHRAGFDVVGVDIDPQPHYPFPFVQGDATCPPVRLEQFDAVHASPPCQAFTPLSNRWRGQDSAADQHEDLTGSIRELLRSTALPYVIENVPGSPLTPQIVLRGSDFGLRVHRPRLFESNIALMSAGPPTNGHTGDTVGIYGKPDGRWLTERADGTRYHAWTWEDRHLIGMGHVTDPRDWHDVAEAIPPAYTEHIGRQLIEAL